MDLWRISRHHSLNGEGGRLYAGRWNNVGNPVVYLADSTGSAMLEVLVHLQVMADKTPPAYTLLNPLHPDASRLKIADSHQAFFDPRPLRPCPPLPPDPSMR